MSMMGELKFFLGISSQSIQRWSICSSNKVYKGASEEVQARRL